MYEYSVQKFRSVCSPKQELSLDEAVISWRGPLKFRTYNPGKITKYGVPGRMVSDLEGEGKSLKKGQSAFWRNGDIIVHVWKDKTCANDKYNQ